MPDRVVMWQVDNQKEVEDLLDKFVVQMEKEGDSLRIVGMEGLNVLLNPGDNIFTDGSRLGIARVEQTEKNNKMVDTQCAWCKKPLKMYEAVMESADTTGVVCSQQCEDAYLWSIRSVMNDPGARQ